MADCISRTRSNFFSVKNEDAFRALIAKAAEEQSDLTITTQEDDGVKTFSFHCDGTLDGIEDPNDVLGITSAEAFYAELQPILADGDACIVMSAGWEKFASVDAEAVVVTSDSIEYIDLGNAAIKAAAKALGKSEWSTNLYG